MTAAKKKRTTKKKTVGYSANLKVSTSLGSPRVTRRRGKSVTYSMDVTSFTFQLGATAQDVITGFQGVLTARAQYLTGCTQYLVQPKGDLVLGVGGESRWFDEARLNVLAEVPLVALNPAPNGGPQANEPPRR